MLRFNVMLLPSCRVTGEWEVVFYALFGAPAESSVAVAVAAGVAGGCGVSDCGVSDVSGVFEELLCVLCRNCLLLFMLRRVCVLCDWIC